MHWDHGYIAVDWGTTNRRAYRLDGGGESIDEIADDHGVLAITGGGFDREVDALRERFGDLPMLLAGMIGSDRGWRKVPYVECPASAASLAAALSWVEPGRTGIVPGVCQRAGRPDVMRGEEVQAIGIAASDLLPDDALICHPGTHCKWVWMQRGEICSFSTAMTGEIFALLQQRSMLSDQLQGVAADGAAFRSAVRAALGGAQPLAELFGIRARALLEGMDQGDGACAASGLLIGADVRAALAATREIADAPVRLAGRGDLCALYAAALEEAGRASILVDGSRAFLAGIEAIREKL